MSTNVIKCSKRNNMNKEEGITLDDFFNHGF